MNGAMLSFVEGGALTVSELIKVKRSAFIIPIPNSIDNHQILNAKFFEEKGYGKVFEQRLRY